MKPEQKTELEKQLAAIDTDRPARVIYAELFPDAVDYGEFVDVLQGVLRAKKSERELQTITPQDVGDAQSILAPHP